MKTFKEFCEQAAPSPFANKPEHPVKRFARDVVSNFAGGIRKKLSDINKTATDLRLAAGIHSNLTDPGTNYMQRDLATRAARLRLRGINPDNPSRMPIDRSTSPVQGSLRYGYHNPYLNKKGFGGKPTTEV